MKEVNYYEERLNQAYAIIDELCDCDLKDNDLTLGQFDLLCDARRAINKLRASLSVEENDEQ